MIGRWSTQIEEATSDVGTFGAATASTSVFSQKVEAPGERSRRAVQQGALSAANVSEREGNFAETASGRKEPFCTMLTHRR